MKRTKSSEVPTSSRPSKKAKKDLEPSNPKPKAAPKKATKASGSPLHEMDLPVLEFSTRTEWRAWLLKNHDKHTKGIWMLNYRKATGQRGIDYGETLLEALCFGWIDGLVKGLDDTKYKQRWCPRTKTSNWSEVNKRKIPDLVKEGLMHSAGLAKIEEAKQNGKWDNPSPMISEMDIEDLPEELKSALAKNKEAKKMWEDNVPPGQKRMFLFSLRNLKTSAAKQRKVEAAIPKIIAGQKQLTLPDSMLKKKKE